MDAPSPEQLRFDSTDLDPAEGFARYRQLYEGGTDASLIGGTFRARVLAWRLERAMLFDRRLNGVAHARTLARVARDKFDHFTVTLVLNGAFEMDSGAGLQHIDPGQGILLDMVQPMANRSIDAHFLTISIARDRMDAATAGIGDDLHGRMIDGQRTALLTDYATALTRRLDMLDTTALAPATDALMSLVALALGAPAGLDDAAQREARRARQIRAIIDRHLGDATFATDELIQLSGLSRSTLYRVLADRGGVAGYIQERRLERLRQQLLDPAEPRTFVALAYDAGFASESHASGVFLERYGLRPGQYRRAHGLFDDPADPGLQLRRWIDEVR